METIEGASVTYQMRPFGLEHLPDRLIGLFGVAVRFGVGNAFVQEPAIQLIETFDPQARCEEPLSHQANLVLDLTLLPS